MADASKTLDGKEPLLFISTNLVTPAYKSVVCSIDNGITGSANVQNTDTKCGQAKARGTANRTVTGSLAYNKAQGTDEISGEELNALFSSGADFLFKVDNAAGNLAYYRDGLGFLSAYNETANTGDVLKMDFTIEVKGDIGTTRPTP